MLYQMHELGRAWLAPMTYWADAMSKAFGAQGSWLRGVPGASQLSAGYELFYRLGKDYEKPSFDITEVEVDGRAYAVVERESLRKPFCRLLHFKRYADDAAGIDALARSPKVLVVAPLSGHHATLLRDTVRTLLRDHDVYITDWVDARMVPAAEGPFHLDDYVAYVEEFIRHLGATQLHVISVCQPTVPVLAAVSLMAARGEATPRSLVMMGGPIDTRENPTQVNDLAVHKPMWWFESQLIHPVPPPYPGAGRMVYPGFLQHMGFVAMNPERHFQSHWDFYENLLQGDLEDAESHRRFYDEYNAVLDMPAEYYLDTVRIVFKEHLLPKGEWDVRGQRVDPSKICETALMTVEGELDDISGRGQTRAAMKLCSGIAAKDLQHLVVEGAGHYGIFSGRRWRTQVYPKLREFFAAHSQN
jgi:poly(3-hydroxybutyrate) depolymerase